MSQQKPDRPKTAGVEEAFLVQLWLPDGSGVEKVLGGAISEELARAIFEAAVMKFTDRRVTLQHQDRLLAENVPKRRS